MPDTSSNANGGKGRLRNQFKLDRSKPLKQQDAESDVMYERFCLWLDNPTQTFEELAQQCGIRADSLGRHSRNYLWKERLALSGKLKNSRGKKLAEAKLPAPPEPIERGLIAFALEYLPAIAPDFQLDSLMEMFLTELEHWVEGEHNFLQISPHPRSGKSLAACAAMAYGYLRYPTRHQILISASGRLSAIANQRLRTLIEIALPEGFELAKDSPQSWPSVATGWCRPPVRGIPGRPVDGSDRQQDPL